MTMQNTVTNADADWSGMSEDETVTNCNALKPERSRTFLEIVVSYPVFCAYPEYEDKPYYAIKYEEKGETIIGFGTYKPKVLSQYLRQYFLPSAEPERKTGHWIDTDNYYQRWKCSECGCHTRDAEPNYCPHCGAVMKRDDR